MVKFIEASSEEELSQILSLQEVNLVSYLSQVGDTSQGFVTVKHDLEILKQMNEAQASIIAKDEDRVVGYCLSMPRTFANAIPVLAPMFNLFDQLQYQGKSINAYEYIVVGQVCVAEGYRGQGIFDGLYQSYKSFLSEKYDFTITEIAKRNLRSQKAHHRVGFQALHEYTDPEGEEWIVVLWDWKAPQY